MSIEAMKQALEALEEVTGWTWAGPMRVMDEVEDAIIALRQAIAEAEKQEPFCMHWEDRWGCNHYVDHKEPHPANAKPLYTHPPKREPLTDERTAFEAYCKTLHPPAGQRLVRLNASTSRTQAEEFFHAGWQAAHGIKEKPNE